MYLRPASIEEANHQCLRANVLEILNDNMVGYANISARDMLYHLFETYDNITAVDLEINFEHMR
jgi:hypothetical protein